MTRDCRTMRRREFLMLLAAGTAAACPIGTQAQVRSTGAIGFLSGGSPNEWAPFVAAFREGLNQMGYVEGHNASVEFRWASGERAKLPAAAQELAARHVDVLVVTGGFP